MLELYARKREESKMKLNLTEVHNQKLTGNMKIHLPERNRMRFQRDDAYLIIH